MFLFKFLAKNPLNIVQLAAPEFVRLSKENWRIKILRTLFENLLIGSSPGINWKETNPILDWFKITVRTGL